MSPTPFPTASRAKFRAHCFQSARLIIADIRRHRDWLNARPEARPFYPEHGPEAVADQMKSVRRLRKWAAQGGGTTLAARVSATQARASVSEAA